MRDQNNNKFAPGASYFGRVRNYWCSLISHLGVPQYPGILVFAVSICVTNEVLTVMRRETYDKMYIEIFEGILLGLLATAVFITIVKSLVRADALDELLRKLSLTLLPGILLFFPLFAIKWFVAGQTIATFGLTAMCCWDLLSA